MVLHPQTYVAQAASARTAGRRIPLEEDIAADLKHLHAELPGEVDIADRTLDDSRWVVVAGAAEAPATYHLYDRKGRKLTKLFEAREELKAYRLAPMHDEVIRSRDSLELVSYLTLPVGEGKRAQAAAAVRASGARRPVGARPLRLQPQPPVARQPRLAVLSGELPRLDRLRQEIRQRRQLRMGRARCTTT